MTKVQSLAKRICEGSAENPQGFPLGAQNFRGSTELADAGQLRRQCPANSSLVGKTLGGPLHQNERIVLMLTLTPMTIIWTRYGVQTAMITAITPITSENRKTPSAHFAHMRWHAIMSSMVVNRPPSQAH